MEDNDMNVNWFKNPDNVEKLCGVYDMRMWRNWQMCTVQVRVKAISCRFKSYHPHQKEH